MITPNVKEARRLKNVVKAYGEKIESIFSRKEATGECTVRIKQVDVEITSDGELELSRSFEAYFTKAMEENIVMLAQRAVVLAEYEYLKLLETEMQTRKEDLVILESLRSEFETSQEHLTDEDF